MSLPRVLLAGPFAEVEVRAGTSSRRREPEVDALIDAEWETQLARARATGTPFSDNPAYRLEAAEGQDGRALLTLASEPYLVHAAMKVLHGHPAVTEAHHDRLLIADGVVRTRDGAAVLQRLPKVTGTATELVGSTCAPHAWPIATGGDLVDYLTSRVARGLAVAPERVAVGPLLGLVLHVVGCVCAVWDVVVDADLAQVRAGHPTPEVLLAVPEAELPALLAAEGGYLPAVAQLPL